MEPLAFSSVPGITGMVAVLRRARLDFEAIHDSLVDRRMIFITGLSSDILFALTGNKDFLLHSENDINYDRPFRYRGYANGQTLHSLFLDQLEEFYQHMFMGDQVFPSSINRPDPGGGRERVCPGLHTYLDSLRLRFE